MADTIGGLVSRGLASVQFAPIGKFSTAAWTTIGDTKAGSVSPGFSAPTITEVKSEEHGAIMTNAEEGTQKIELDLLNVKSDVLTSTFGLTLTSGTTEDVVWVTDTSISINKMVRFNMAEGIKALVLANADIYFNPANGFKQSGDDTFNLHITIYANKGLGGATAEEGIYGFVYTHVGA